jgi:hypothetical protein
MDSQSNRINLRIPCPGNAGLVRPVRRRSEFVTHGWFEQGPKPSDGKENLLRQKPRSNLTGVGNTRTVPVGERVEGVSDE